MPEEPTHTPKKVVINGREKVVYSRTEETKQYRENYRMGFFAKYEPLALSLFGDKLKANQLVISAPYQEAVRVIRTRLGLDRSPHRVLTGTTLLQYYFGSGGEYREGFPVFKQLYLLFGYSESTNKRLHEVVNEGLFTRYHNDGHFWLIMPSNLEVMAAQWGDALANLNIFPQLLIPKQEESAVAGPVSVANPIAKQHVDEQMLDALSGSSARSGADGGPPPIPDNPDEARRQQREWEKRRRSL